MKGRYTCAVEGCGIEFASGPPLSRHLWSSHSLSVVRYLVEVLGMDGNCVTCGMMATRVGFRFRKSCSLHAKIAMSEGGKKGGTAPAWNRGKTKETDSRIAMASEQMFGSGNHFFGRKHSEQTIDRIRRTKRLETDEILERFYRLSRGQFEPVDLEQYRFRQDHIKVRCIKCGFIDDKKLEAVERGTRCKKCDGQGRSIAEEEIASFVESLGLSVTRNDRRSISPMEIDVLVPEAHVGIEHDGLYWHSISGRRTPLEKVDVARSAGIMLLTFYSDEWRDRKEVVKGIISHKLGRSSVRSYARKLFLSEIDPKEAKLFLDVNHIAGGCRASVAFALRSSDGIAAVLTLRDPFHRTHLDAGRVEVGRFSTASGTAVVGGLSRLLTAARGWASNNGHRSIMTYADRRLGNGTAYSTVGMELVGPTGPSYWYTDGRKRIDRFTVRARDGMSEAEVAASMNVRKVWSPGSLLFELKI